jgi:hypothetical protein
VDNDDRTWLLELVRKVMKERMGSDFDKVFKHLRHTAGPIGLEDVRRMFFGDFMDSQAETASQRVYDEAQVRPRPLQCCGADTLCTLKSHVALPHELYVESSMHHG